MLILKKNGKFNPHIPQRIMIEMIICINQLNLLFHKKINKDWVDAPPVSALIMLIGVMTHSIR